MTHADYSEHIEYQRAYNRTVAGKARARKYRQSPRGKLYERLRKQRQCLRKQGLPLLPEHYMRGYCDLHETCPTDPSPPSQNNIGKPECNALAPAHD